MKAGDGFKARADGGGRAAFTTADATAVSALSSRQVMQQAKLKRTTLSVQIAVASSEDGPVPWTGGDGRMAQELPWKVKEMTAPPNRHARLSFRLLCVLSLCRGSGASLVRIRSASSRWRVSCTDGTTHEGRGRFAGRLLARDDSICTLSFDFRAKDGLDVAPAAVILSSLVGEQPAVPMEGGEEVAVEPSHPFRRTAAVNQTDSSRGCSDFPLPFVENPSQVTLLGGNCSTTIALSSHLFPAFASGIPSVCRASYEVWVQQTGLLQFSTSPPPLAYGVTDPSAPMAELCAATCAAAGVQSSHCAVPSPPPTPPPIPPPAGGTGNGSQPIVATTIEQLHQALSTGYSRGRVDIRVPAGIVLHLEGRMLLIDGINATIRSDAGEAVLDAQGRSRMFEVLSGGSLLLESLRLLNGWADISGGALMIQGAAATLVRCSLLNSSSAAAGGVAIVLDGDLLLLDCLVRRSSSTYGGAFCVNGASAVFLQHSAISLSSAVQNGGVIYSVGDSSTTFVIACDISDSSAARGGVISAVLGGSASISRKSKISNSSASSAGGCLFANAGVISLADGCHVSHSRATQSGGMLACFLTVFTMNNCTIEYSTLSEVEEGGGALWLRVSSYCAISNYSTIAHSIAPGESEGGAIFLAASTLEMSLGCRILHSTAEIGGAILVNAGNMRMADSCLIANSASTRDGGAIHITSGSVIISGGSKILDSTTVNGGALNLVNTIFVMSAISIIANSTAATSGGAMALFGGSFVMTGGSSLSYSSANDGGAISIGGTNSICNLTDSVIEASTSIRRGSVFDIVDANYPLLILTFVEIKQFVCQDSLFSVSQTTLSDAVILRNVTLTQPECTATPHEPTPATTLGCGDKFRSSEKERGVCASGKADACFEQGLPVTGLKSVTWCVSPIA
ncbi:hypothetical protein AB1Y20_016366 [Prymnesium parvum]|uniref:Right handed beta helix domain-containing protein n=1 Tax=Prymnesium parvum TaxID=97485 RepID=A0AB34ICH9_PRYPA